MPESCPRKRVMQDGRWPSQHDHSAHLLHPKYRADIDGLRALAILSVVGYHAFPEWIRGGFVGVDIFFVISGFLISTIIFGSLERNTFSFAEFYNRRIRRIFPALLLVLLAVYVLGWFVLLADEYKQLGKHIAGGAGFVSNFILWNESGYFDYTAEAKPLLNLWSLGIEEQFYIIWPLLLWLAWKWKRGFKVESAKHNFLIITLAVAVISFATNIFTVNEHAVAAFYSPLSRFWELMAGGMLAFSVLHRHPYLSKHPDWQSALGLLLIAAAVFVTRKGSAFPGWWALLPVVGAFLVISAGAQAWINRIVLSHRLLVWIGLISFPLYLWHWPLLSLARIVLGGAPAPEMRAAIVLVSVVLAWLTYRLVEKPIRSGNHSNGKTNILCLLMLAIGSVGYVTYKSDGYGFRLPEFISGATKFNSTDEWRLHQCFLSDDDTSFNSDCLDHNKRPLIFLWGDSHAASLYPGLKVLARIFHAKTTNRVGTDLKPA